MTARAKYLNEYVYLLYSWIRSNSEYPIRHQDELIDILRNTVYTIHRHEPGRKIRVQDISDELLGDRHTEIKLLIADFYEYIVKTKETEWHFLLHVDDKTYETDCTAFTFVEAQEKASNKFKQIIKEPLSNCKGGEFCNTSLGYRGILPMNMLDKFNK